MPKFRVSTKSYIGNTIVDEGTVVDFDGIPGPNLEPLEPAAVAQADLAVTAKSDSLMRQAIAAAGGELTDPVGAAGLV